MIMIKWNIRKKCEISLKLTIKTSERRHTSFSVFIVNFEHISHLPVFLLLLGTSNLAGMNLLKVNNGNTRKSCEICLKLTIKTPERGQMSF